MAELKKNVLQSVARLKQIERGLVHADKKERAARKKLRAAKQSTAAGLLEVNNDFLRAKIELYNEALRIENGLLNECMQPLTQADKKEIVRLAKQLNLPAVLRKRRVALKRRDGGRRCPIFCSECVTGCTACVTSCTQCVVTHRCTAQSMPIG